MKQVARSGWRVAALVLLATLLAQTAWILAVPPFRGMDEFDHAFRAAGVASGQWRLAEPVEDGRGQWVEVPEDLRDAATVQCSALPYTVPTTCVGEELGDGRVRVATAAGAYNPAYYWVVGTVAEPASGATALYMMRFTSAFLCALLIAAAAAAVRTWAPGPWVVVGLLLGTSPTLLYSTTVVAPNGLEMAAGLCLWASVLGLGSPALTGRPDPARHRTELLLLAAAATSAALLCTLRTLGPLWVLLILGCAALVRLRAWLPLVARHRGLIVLGVLAVSAAASAALWWSSSNSLFHGAEADVDEVDSSWTQTIRFPNWILGSIGAFPYRDQPAPLGVYVLFLLVLGWLLFTAVRRSEGWSRRALVVSTILSMAVPFLLVWMTLEDRGGSWQGRYSLPFVCGIPVLAGAWVDRARAGRRPLDTRPLLLALTMLAVAQTWSVLSVLHTELGRRVSRDEAGWLQPPLPVVGLLMVLAFAIWVHLALSSSRSREVAAQHSMEVAPA